MAKLSTVTSLALASALATALETLAEPISGRRSKARLSRLALLEWGHDVPPFPVFAGELARARRALPAHTKNRFAD